jgi:hypothetical protein
MGFSPHLSPVTTLSQSSDASGVFAMGFFCIFALIAMAAFAFWVWTIVDAVKNPRLSDNTRLIWILVIVLVGPLGSLIYLLAGRNG